MNWIGMTLTWAGIATVYMFIGYLLADMSVGAMIAMILLWGG